MTTENIIGLLLISFQVQIILIAWQIGYKRKYHRGYTGRTGDQGEKGDMGPKGIDYKKEDNWVVKRIGNNEGNQVEYLVIVNTRLKREWHEWTRDKAKATLLNKATAGDMEYSLKKIEGYAYTIERMRIEDQSNWLIYRNQGIRWYETRDEYLNKVVLNQVHNHRVIIRYLVIIIVGLTTLLLK